MYTKKQMPAIIARRQAYLTGERFYNGSPHRGCGLTLRYTVSGNCVVCQKQRAADRYISFKLAVAHVPS